MEELFSDKFEMFPYNEESRSVWFSRNISESDEQQFALVGILIGMAVYNGNICWMCKFAKVPP